MTKQMNYERREKNAMETHKELNNTDKQSEAKSFEFLANGTSIWLFWLQLDES